MEGDTFSIDAIKNGFLLVFFNNDASQNEFGFEYWLDITNKPQNEVGITENNEEKYQY